MVQPRRFTREECHHLLEAGVIPEDERAELIESTVAEMSPIESQHAGVGKSFNALFHPTLADQALVRVQDPIRLPVPGLQELGNEPSPRFP
ncbi:hypothetical protein [Thermus caldilimi]|uniref:hypothetical protein n=1 Tax=Thermus caldilimi TaxID=2483360 RepID=UPI001076200B|nr:hypothetical protein [Thermus caldilimi]